MKFPSTFTRPNSAKGREGPDGLWHVARSEDCILLQAFSVPTWSKKTIALSSNLAMDILPKVGFGHSWGSFAYI